MDREHTALSWLPDEDLRAEGFDVAIASTDVDASTAGLIARYDSRWTIET